MATIANHAAAAWLGAWVTRFVGPTTLTVVVGLLFIAMAVWVLIPDKLEGDTPSRMGGVFLTTTALFFIAEIGDKTQLATVMLAARYQALAAVVVGTTLGMMLANVPVVFFGERISRRLRVDIIRRIAAVAFAALGVAALLSA